MEGDGNLDNPSVEVQGEGVILVIHSLDYHFADPLEGFAGELLAREGIDDLQVLAVGAKGKISGLLGICTLYIYIKDRTVIIG